MRMIKNVQKITLVTSDLYDVTLIREIDRAKRRIIIKSMTFQLGPRIAAIVDSAEAACRRGCSVAIHLDIYSVLVRPSTLRYLYMLRKRGILVRWHGKLRINPFARRSHSKFAIVDDCVFAFGGMNFKESAFVSADYMLQIKDVGLSEWLLDILDGPSMEAKSHKIDAQSMALYDSGKPGDSTIYDTACYLAKGAKTIFFVSKMSPSGVLAEIITAKRAVLYYNPPGHPKLSLLSTVAAVLDQHKYKTCSKWKSDVYLHAKCLIATNKVSSILSGSHNLNRRGVQYGTDEIALVSQDSQLACQIERYIANQSDSKGLHS